MLEKLHWFERESYGSWGKGVLFYGNNNMGYRLWFSDCREATLHLNESDEAVVKVEGVFTTISPPDEFLPPHLITHESS